MPQVSHAQAVWPALGTTSNAVALSGCTLTGLLVPAAFTGTAITFLVSNAFDGVYAPLKDFAGVAVACTVAGAGNHRAAPSDWVGVSFLKLVSNASEAANRVVLLAVREAA